MSAKYDQQDLAIKEAYRKWHSLKMEMKQVKELLSFAGEVIRLELEQVQAKMENDLMRLDSEIASLRTGIKKAYDEVGERKSLNDAAGARMWYQIATERKEQLDDCMGKRRKLVAQMAALTDEFLRQGEYWEGYVALAEEAEVLRGNLKQLQREVTVARTDYTNKVLQKEMAKESAQR